MKKLLLTALLLATFTVSFAQTSREDFKASMERMEKLKKLSVPKTTSINTLDDLNNKIGSSAVEAISITPLLQNLYYRSVGQTNDGVTDVSVKKPTMKECEELAARIFLQSKNVEALSSSITSATSEATKVTNPLKLVKITSAVNYAKDASSLLGTETLFQTKAIKSIMETLKTAGNL
ncbi:hypothetical protein [Soonwooa sp.]|uniref:hypothetical protein n=1 Tax=Soonwooa sp. TaxID=1938592 RepID=UPI0026321226|nr:hypothetical protein [Soonwooa sp.]